MGSSGELRGISLEQPTYVGQLTEMSRGGREGAVGVIHTCRLVQV